MKIAFLSSPRAAAQRALKDLTDRYGQATPEDAEYIVSVGGDGTALRALQATLPIPAKPVFAMRTEASVGILANPLHLTNLRRRLRSAAALTLHPIRADIEQTDGQCRSVFAINEIVLIRQRLQTAKLRYEIQGQQAPTLITGDGLMMVTPLGSTAYNRGFNALSPLARPPRL
jgi:NAD+ kinase